ncbi:MAG: UvrD-helicase domain-containing protein [Bdellovibrionaceae bacterium]|nr:UvrD-helicase domain-containing protein [Pseudobdellovibrionaceae bacterium]
MPSPSPVSKNILIRAGAGAGKTTRLIEEVYGYFLAHKSSKSIWPRVVLTTFSNKATQEINERLLKKAIETNDVDFFSFINSKAHLLVSTIHGVLHQFISKNQSEFGLTKDFKVANDADISRRQQKIFRSMVHADSHAALLLDMFSLSELYSLVTNYRYFKLTEGVLQPFSVTAFRDYLNQQREDILSEFRQSYIVLIQSKLTDSWSNAIQNFPRLEQDNLQNLQELVYWEETLARLPVVAKKAEADLVLAQAGFVSAVKKLREFKLRNYHEDFLSTFQFLQLSFQELADRYLIQVEKDRRQTQEISISDIETLCFQILSEKSFLFDEYSKNWDFWMIDEFQDTSPIQISLLNGLIGQSRVFFVGDPQQSIYYFRGSDSRVFEGKMGELRTTGHVEVLDNNYRSHLGVLSFINEFFSRQYSQFQKMIPTKPAVNLDQDVRVFEMTEKSEFSVLTARQIAKFIADAPDTKLEDIVILSRTNRDLENLAIELEALGVPHYVHSQGQFFKQREVLDVMFFVRFLIRPDDASNLAYLLRSPAIGMVSDEIKRVLKDFISWQALLAGRDLHSPKVSSDIQKLDGYLKKCHEIGLVETAQLFWVNEGAFVLNYVVDSSGKKESNIWKFFYWLRRQLTNGMDNFLLQMESILDPNKNDEYEESETQAIIEPKKIQMMTIHASKGLQFAHVIVIGLHNSSRTRTRWSLDVDPETKEYSIFIKNKAKDDKIRSPIHWRQWAIQKERESEEFERLLYVALTRAKQKISLFTGRKFSETTWSQQLSDFYNQYLMNETAMSFRMGWETIDLAILPEVFFDKTGDEPSAAPRDKTPKYFFDMLESFLQGKETVGPLSFSSSRGPRQSTLNQVIISQKGIETHHRREKGYVDFSYYPDLNLANSWAEIFQQGFREYRFTFQFGQFQIAGSMDFVYFMSERIVIIDYKSGRSTHSELYIEQLKFYAQCLMHIKKLSFSTKFALVIDYVDQKKVEHFSYTPVETNPYFDKFILDRELEKI